MSELQAVTEEELHAYVDGELSPERARAVEEWLAHHPFEAARVAQWRAQIQAIRAHYGPAAFEPPPARLELEKLTHPRPRWQSMAAAAGLAAFLLGAGGATGWVARGALSPTAPPTASALTAEALDAYRLYVVEVRHPVEVPGSEAAHLTQWLSRRLGWSLKTPDLDALGLRLIGGRLLPAPTGPAGFLMYEGASGERFTIYCARARARDTAMRFRSEGPLAAVTWVERDVAYVVSGEGDRARLEKVAQAAYPQLDEGLRNSPQR